MREINPLSMKEWAGRRTAARRGGTPGQVCLVSAVASLFVINSALFVVFSKQVNDTLLDCEHQERAAGFMRCAQDAMDDNAKCLGQVRNAINRPLRVATGHLARGAQQPAPLRLAEHADPLQSAASTEIPRATETPANRKEVAELKARVQRNDELLQRLSAALPRGARSESSPVDLGGHPERQSWQSGKRKRTTKKRKTQAHRDDGPSERAVSSVTSARTPANDVPASAPTGGVFAASESGGESTGGDGDASPGPAARAVAEGGGVSGVTGRANGGSDGEGVREEKLPSSGLAERSAAKFALEQQQRLWSDAADLVEGRTDLSAGKGSGIGVGQSAFASTVKSGASGHKGVGLGGDGRTDLVDGIAAGDLPVAVVAYARAHYLRRCLESLLAVQGIDRSKVTV